MSSVEVPGYNNGPFYIWLDENGRPTSPPKLHYDDVTSGGRNNGFRRVSAMPTIFLETYKDYQSTVAYWYAICFIPGGPGFKFRQRRELLILNKKELLI